MLYEVRLYKDSYPFYYENLRYCGMFAGGETFRNLSKAEAYAENILKKYRWLEKGYAHIYKFTYLGIVDGYTEELVKEIEY